MSRSYQFHSPLPPEQLPRVLPGAVRFQDRTAKLEVCVKTRWRGRRFTVTRTTVRRYTAEDGWIPRGHGVGWTKGRRMDWQWNNPFCGKVRSDGQGGSVLSGRFRIHPAGKPLFAVFALVIVYSLWFLSPRNVETMVVAAVAAALYLRHLIHACRDIDTYEGAESILCFLREKFEEVEE